MPDLEGEARPEKLSAFVRRGAVVGRNGELADRIEQLENDLEAAREFEQAQPSELFDEALTERQSRVRLDCARAMYRVQAKQGIMAEGLTDQEILDAFWDELDAIWPILRKEAK